MSPATILRMIVLATVALGVAAARADVLYKCEGPGGSVAYTNKKDSFRGCTALGSYAAPKTPAPPARSVAAVPAKAWDYRESIDPKAQRSGVTSTAPMLSAATSTTMPAQPVAAVAPLATGESGSTVMTSPTTAKIAPKVLRGAVYRVDRANGITEYTNVRPRDGRYALLFSYISTCVACDIHSKIDFASTRLNLEAYRDEIAGAAAEFGVDPALLRAVMHAESAFNPMALSAKGAQGLMQLMPGTATDLGVDDAFDVSQNIRGGAMYIAQMLRSFNGDERLATAAYNAGPGAVQKYGDVPPYAETQVYVQRVATLRERYRKAL